MLPFSCYSPDLAFGLIDGLMCPPSWNDVQTGQVLPMLWLDVAMSVHPSGPCSHVSWRKGEDEERQQEEHDGRCKERKQYHHEDEYVLYQAQYYVEKTSGRESGNESRSCFDRVTQSR